MSLQKWQKLAKSKTNLGNQINSVRDAIKKNYISHKASQESFSKLFKPKTGKLDEVVDSSLNVTPIRKRQRKKGEAPDYNIPIEDEVPDMNLNDLFDETVLPQNDKRVVAKPPSYEDSLQDIYVDPQYFKEQPDELPPEYDEYEVPDYEIGDEDMQKDIVNKMDLQDYENVDKILAQEQMNPQRSKKYLQKTVKDAIFRRNQLKGYKANITKDYNQGKISSAERQLAMKRLDDARGVLNQYIKHYETRIKTMSGSGLRKQKGDDDTPHPITLEFDDTIFRVEITLAENYQFDLRESNFNELIGFNKVLLNLESMLAQKFPIYHKRLIF
ncbi:hypothetical protein AWC38_SpisGene23925 [Stylophora pistillata]|uniref:Uncharacterized protein n=1 Tax=Stylophora pistillata TaxID=50429 RepID=A0A2B4R3G5_STYPI|nr:hypothetical protein AWC38_SpisGene23925 [Stylophora pistillata]